MSNQTHTNPLPAVSLPLPAFAVQVKPVVARIRAVLKGRAKTCTLPLSDSTVSPLELAPADKQGNRAHRTFTRAQVVAIAREVVAIMSEKPSPSAVRDKVPSYWLGPKARESDLVKALGLTYTPSKGNSAGQRRNAAAHCVGAYRRDVKRLAKANTLATTLKAGTGWFAVGVLDNKGQPRPYPSEKKARKAFCRLNYTVYAADGKTVLEHWFEADKATASPPLRCISRPTPLARPTKAVSLASPPPPLTTSAPPLSVPSQRRPVPPSVFTPALVPRLAPDSGSATTSPALRVS